MLKKTILKMSALFLSLQGSLAFAFPQTIVFVRHGEKPAGTKADPDYGHLTRKGLNRALHVPLFLERNFGTPSFIFTPRINLKKSYPIPTLKNQKNTVDITSEQRALETSMPSLVYFNVPLIDKVEKEDLQGLYNVLKTIPSRTKLVAVFWEHHNAAAFLQKEFKYQQAAWPDSDFDRVYVAKYDKSTKSFQVHMTHEGLNSLKPFAFKHHRKS